ncbi:MAG: dual specificity protein phosphatase family protein [Chloroflexi bacterium]|nr:dual specificity protein phosphatase family protein [Chloroflexota bacterium]
MTRLPIIESYWVEEGRFLAGEYPGSYNPEESRRRIDAFLESGLRVFIDLTQPHELVPYEPILKEQAQIYEYMTVYHRFAIRDHGVPSHQTMRLILDTIDAALQSNSPVYVHCWGGVGRTGTVVGCYLIRHGLSARQALERVDALYKTRPHDYFLARSPETEQQFEFVRHWREPPFTDHRSKQRFCEG